jgi:hypothetical protein
LVSRSGKGEKKESKAAHGNTPTTTLALAIKIIQGFAGLSFTTPFRSLEGVHLGLLLALSLQFCMRGKIAVTGFPFERGIRISIAESPSRQFHDAITAVALFHDLVTRSPIVPTAGFSHEGTVSSSLQCCTIHSDYLQEKND